MDKFIHLLNHTSAQSQVIILTVTLVICWNIENVAGLAFKYSKWEHSFLNAKFIVSNLPPQLMLGILFSKTLLWTSMHHFGVIYGLPFHKNELLLSIYSFIMLDFGEYIYHVIMHKQKRLWMFHIVHHSDTCVDVSTTLREHPGENIIRNIMTLAWIFLTGIPFWALVLRQIIQIISNAFSHVNYRLPQKVDSVLGWIFITPNLHHVHHHHVQPFTDCNYGDVLSIWDRMFGTFYSLKELEVVYGVDTCADEKETSSYFLLIKLPFGRYRKQNRLRS